MSQGSYKATTGRTALHLEQGLAPLVNPQPAAAAINVSGLLGKAFVLGNGGRADQPRFCLLGEITEGKYH